MIRRNVMMTLAGGMVLAAASAAPAAVVSVDYDTEGDLVDNFAFSTTTEDTSDTDYDRQDGIGTGSPASGGVDLVGNGAVATYDQQSFDLTAEGSSLTLSHDILYDEQSNDGVFTMPPQQNLWAIGGSGRWPSW